MPQLTIGDTVWIPWTGWVTVKEILVNNLTYQYLGSNEEGQEYYFDDKDW